MLVIGHRGASAALPENTLAAFQGAIDQGADGVELDVRRTVDGALALSHDDTLADGRVVVETAIGPTCRPRCPILAGALDVCRPLPVVNIEIKNWPDDKDFDPTEQLADGRGGAARRRGASSTTGATSSRASTSRRSTGCTSSRPALRHGLAARARRGPRAARSTRAADARPRRRPPPPRVRERGRSSLGPTTPAWPSTPGPATSPTGSGGWPTSASTPSSPTCPTSRSPRWVADRRRQAQRLVISIDHPRLGVARRSHTTR